MVSGKEIQIIYDAWPDAVSATNKLSKTPLDYWWENEEDEVIGDIIGGKGTLDVTCYNTHIIMNMYHISYTIQQQHRTPTLHNMNTIYQTTNST